MHKIIKRHWRIIIPILIMGIIFYFSSCQSATSESLSKPIADFFGLSHELTRKIAHFILFASLGASWAYYLRVLGRFTPGFTALGSLLFVFAYAVLDEIHQIFIPGRAGLFSDVLLDAVAGIVGIFVFDTLYYLTRSKQQRTARRKQVDQIWANNAKLIKKLQKPPKK